MKKLAILEEELAELGVILNRGGGVHLGGNLDRVCVHLAATAHSTAHESMRAETYVKLSYTYFLFARMCSYLIFLTHPCMGTHTHSFHAWCAATRGNTVCVVTPLHIQNMQCLAFESNDSTALSLDLLTSAV